MRRTEPGRAFTLIELITVVGIIAMLATLLVPAVLNGLRYAKLTKCAGNLKDLLRAAETVRSVHKAGGPPYLPDENWVDLVLPYIGNNTKVLACPEDPTVVPGETSYAVNGAMEEQDIGCPRVFILDYAKYVDGGFGGRVAYPNDDWDALPSSPGRHISNKVSTVFGDGSVEAFRVSDIRPDVEDNRIFKWEPPR